jgi:hypothetical protein
MPQIEFAINFVINHWQTVAIAFGPLTAYLIIRRLTKGSRKSAAELARHNQRAADASMVLAAIDTGLETNQADYLNRYILDELAKQTALGTKAESIGFRLGLLMVICSPISSLITGGNISAAGFSPLQLSFATTSIGTLVGGVLMFGGWPDKAIRATELARKIRNEVWEFTARAMEYRGQSPEEAWFLLTQSIQALLSADISAESAHAKQKAQARDGNKTEGEEGAPDA